MHIRERRIQQRIDRRKRKVRRMIREQKVRLAALDDVTFLHQEDRRQALARIKNKLHRLEKELRGLKSGMLRWEE